MYLNGWHIYGALGRSQVQVQEKEGFFSFANSGKKNLETIEFDNPPKNTPRYEVSNIYKRFIQRKRKISNKKSEKV